MAPGRARLVCFASLSLLFAAPGEAADVPADPSSFAGLLPTLRPGDALVLAPGSYTHFTLSGVAGNDGAEIVIRGPSSGAPAVIVADSGPCCNTIQLQDASYIALESLRIDGRGIDGAFGVDSRGATHHIRIEGCTFIGHDAAQQTVAISTKGPAWSWIIRRNRIDGAGTGMYLGNSDGTQPFIGGLIEGNLFTDTIGYNIEIKWQQPRPAVAGIPTTPQVTIIRRNVFIKKDRPSPDGDRPNLLVGGFPANGPGAEDRYEIYGNFFFHNPREALFQASGRVSLHDNLFVDVPGTAIRLQNHDLPLLQAFVYNNTIYSAGTGVELASAAPQGDAVVGNLIFSPQPLAGSMTDQRDNITGSIAEAASYLTSPSISLGMIDLYPLPNGRSQGAALDLTRFAADTGRDVDFNGTSKAGDAFRGAYAGEGTNPGWRPIEDLITDLGPPIRDDAGAADAAGGNDASLPPGDSGSTARDAGTPPRSDAAGASPDVSINPLPRQSGCGCRSAEGSAGSIYLGLLLLGLALFGRRALEARMRMLVSR